MLEDTERKATRGEYFQHLRLKQLSEDTKILWELVFLCLQTFSAAFVCLTDNRQKWSALKAKHVTEEVLIFFSKNNLADLKKNHKIRKYLTEHFKYGHFHVKFRNCGVFMLIYKLKS